MKGADELRRVFAIHRTRLLDTFQDSEEAVRAWLDDPDFEDKHVRHENEVDTAAAWGFLSACAALGECTLLETYDRMKDS